MHCLMKCLVSVCGVSSAVFSMETHDVSSGEGSHEVSFGGVSHEVSLGGVSLEVSFVAIFPGFICHMEQENRHDQKRVVMRVIFG